MPNAEETLNDLVRDLCWSHATSTMGRVEDMLIDASESPRRKVVCILGAGASHALQELPTGKQAAAQAEAMLGFAEGSDTDSSSPYGGRSKLYRNQLDELEEAFALDRTEFETRFLAMSNLDRPATLEVMHELFETKYRPNEGYEILAHMLKHRFLHAVISYNFDELFDEALRGEMRSTEYHRVVSSEESLSGSVSSADDGGGRCFFVKPHGTLSREETLRFTRRDYHNIPPAVDSLIGTLLDPDQPVALWVIGFGMKSREFVRLLTERLGSTSWADSRIYHTIPEPRSRFSLGLPKAEEKVFQSIYRPLPPEPHLNGLVEELWCAIRSRFQDGFTPRDIWRHKFLALTMRSCPKPTYYRRRTMAELVLAVAKAKGWVSFADLAQGRTGYFYEKLRSKEPDSESLLDMCETVGLSPVSYSAATLHLGDASAGHWTTMTTAKESAADELMIRFERNTGLTMESPVREEAVQNLRSIWTGREVEVSHTPAARLHQFMCRSALPIHTYGELIWRTHQLLLDDWTALFVIAETGEWLADLPPAIRERVSQRISSVAMVVADVGQYEDRLRPNLNLPETGLRQMPWWGHNVHMTLSLGDLDGQMRVLQCIVFSRRLRSASIAPVLIADPDDADGLLDTFVAYWAKSRPDGKVRYVDTSAIEEARAHLETSFLGGHPLPQRRLR